MNYSLCHDSSYSISDDLSSAAKEIIKGSSTVNNMIFIQFDFAEKRNSRAANFQFV